MNPDDLRRAVDAALKKTKCTFNTNYFGQVSFEAIVRECTTDATGKLLPASKAQRALQNAARGVGKGRWSRLLLKGNTKSPLAKAIGAIKLPIGKGGRRPKTAAREQLDEFLGDLSDDAWTLFTMPGQQGSPSLDMNDPSASALVTKLARRYGVSEDKMLTAVNESRAWLAAQFGALTVDNVRRNAHRGRSL